MILSLIPSRKLTARLWNSQIQTGNYSCNGRYRSAWAVGPLDANFTAVLPQETACLAKIGGKYQSLRVQLHLLTRSLAMCGICFFLFWPKYPLWEYLESGNKPDTIYIHTEMHILYVLIYIYTYMCLINIYICTHAYIYVYTIALFLAWLKIKTIVLILLKIMWTWFNYIFYCGKYSSYYIPSLDHSFQYIPKSN
jgi:hypothetical protein